MTEKRFKIIDKQFISYYGGNAHLISNGNCKFWLWHDESGSQKVCDKLNIIMEENEQLKKENEQLKKDVEYWKQVASQYSNELNVFEHCKKHKTECKDIYWDSD